MSMNILVTKKSNVTIHEEGAGLEGIELVDESAVGYLRKTHMIQATIQDPQTGQIQVGAVARSEVYWENERCPAFTLEDPSDLVWLQMDSLDEADYSKEDDYESDDEPEIHNHN